MGAQSLNHSARRLTHRPYLTIWNDRELTVKLTSSPVKWATSRVIVFDWDGISFQIALLNRCWFGGSRQSAHISQSGSWPIFSGSISFTAHDYITGMARHGTHQCTARHSLKVTLDIDMQSGYISLRKVKTCWCLDRSHMRGVCAYILLFADENSLPRPVLCLIIASSMEMAWNEWTIWRQRIRATIGRMRYRNWKKCLLFLTQRISNYRTHTHTHTHTCTETHSHTQAHPNPLSIIRSLDGMSFRQIHQQWE